MQDFREYLRAYRAYVLAKRGWLKGLLGPLVWLVGMFAPAWAKAFVQFPSWLAITWMVGWALLGYVFAPYGMWKHQRRQMPKDM
jgi:hypothetical protein